MDDESRRVDVEVRIERQDGKIARIADALDVEREARRAADATEREAREAGDASLDVRVSAIESDGKDTHRERWAAVRQGTVAFLSGALLAALVAVIDRISQR